MAQFRKCPKCDQPLCLPDDLDSTVQLQCPLCHASFWPNEALAMVLAVAVPVAGPSAGEPEPPAGGPDADPADVLAPEVPQDAADHPGVPGEATVPTEAGEAGADPPALDPSLVGEMPAESMPVDQAIPEGEVDAAPSGASDAVDAVDDQAGPASEPWEAWPGAGAVPPPLPEGSDGAAPPMTPPEATVEPPPVAAVEPPPLLGAGATGGTDALPGGEIPAEPIPGEPFHGDAVAGEHVAPDDAQVADDAIDSSLFGGPPREGGAGGVPPIVRRYEPERSSFSGLRNLLGIVAGGVLGPLVAYYALNYFGGPQFNFFKIHLPGIPHTYQQGSMPSGENGARVKSRKPRPGDMFPDIPGADEDQPDTSAKSKPAKKP